MAASSLLAVTLVPVTMGLFIRGRIHRERSNPINRWLIALYRPIITFVLQRRWPAVGAALVVLILTAVPWSRIGGEFMPPLDEGTILFMPTTLPGVSVARAREILRIQDGILKSFPEVDHVWGKAGRANTATDPAGLDMFETTITLRPESEWRKGMTYDGLVAAMDSAVRLPGITNAWTMPIKARNDMLATGIRTPAGVKIFGPDLAELERLGKQVERAVQMVPGTRSAFAERAVSGYYLDIDIDRAAAARHGLNVGDVQIVIATAVGGMTITQTVEGRERYGVRIRYPVELRDKSTPGCCSGASSMGSGSACRTLGPCPVSLPAAMSSEFRMRVRRGASSTAWTRMRWLSPRCSARRRSRRPRASLRIAATGSGGMTELSRIRRKHEHVQAHQAGGPRVAGRGYSRLP